MIKNDICIKHNYGYLYYPFYSLLSQSKHFHLLTDLLQDSFGSAQIIKFKKLVKES